ncbi:6-deoxy-6-sulfogluconolactonase [Nymphon striatum]|nr:6-deoxy-6-sulfogluconolactonase [Nymphon striatum]
MHDRYHVPPPVTIAVFSSNIYNKIYKLITKGDSLRKSSYKDNQKGAEYYSLLSGKKKYMKRSLPIECVLDAKADIGEGAIWCSRLNVLYWVDISAGALHRFDPSNNTNQSWMMGESLGCFALTERATVVLALESGFYEFSPETGQKTRLSGPDLSPVNQRFNDGSVDQRGRFYAGTMRTNG